MDLISSTAVEKSPTNKKGRRSEPGGSVHQLDGEVKASPLNASYPSSCSWSALCVVKVGKIKRKRGRKGLVLHQLQEETSLTATKPQCVR